MLTLLAAAMALAATSADADVTGRRIIATETPLMQARNCGLWDAHPVRREAPAPQSQPLGDLPPANMELTVLRLDAEGCSVPVIVRRNVSGDGRSAPPER